MFRAFRRFALALAIVASPISFADQALALSEPADGVRALEDAFRAFRESAMRANNNRATELARWTGPIYLAFANTPGLDRARPEVEAAVNALAAIARVRVERVAASDPRVNFMVQASGRNSMGNSRCFTTIDWDGAGAVTRVEVNLNMSNLERLTRCVNHEVLHGFGFRDHPDGAFSVLSYKYNTQAQMTDTDRVLLATLYDPRLPATGSMDQIGRIACGLIAERLNVSPDRAAPVCERQVTPAPRTSIFARASSNQRDNIGQ